jgi:hypothetical protein
MLEGEFACLQRGLIEHVGVNQCGPVVGTLSILGECFQQVLQLCEHHGPCRVGAALAKLEAEAEQRVRMLSGEHC